ncbi:MAG: WD40/YVTN/BNR-like repeat-containing protein [Chloroflexota bacterium]
MNGTKARFVAAVVLMAGVALLAASPLQAGAGAFTSALPNQTFSQVAVDPANPKVVYAAGNDSSLNPYVYKSFDSGNTWAAVGSGLGQFNVYGLAVNKVNDNIVYVGGYNPNTHLIALYESTNGGANWNVVATSLGDNSVQGIALDPTAANTSYLGLNHGVAKSTDGTNWTMLAPMNNMNVQSMAIDRSAVPVVYAGTNAATNPGVWKSADGGQTWANVNNGLPAGSVFFLAIDTTTNSTMYAAEAGYVNQPFQLAKTTNSGQSWIQLKQDNPMTGLVVDPLNGLNVYYETASGVFRSGDGGNTFSQIYTSGGGGFAVDGVNPQTFYVGTTSGLALYTAAPPPAVAAATPTPAPTAGPCQFVLGFATLQSLATADVGTCTDSQAYAANGDAQQHTSNGLLAWRKADNWTAFTNGYRTWINGPSGLVKRLNTQRYSWEANPDSLPIVK